MERIKSESEYNMFDWWKKVFIHNYANFSGRARRSEYWYYTLINIAVIFLLYVITITGAISQIMSLMILGLLPLVVFTLATLIPTLAVGYRRLQDTGKPGLLVLIGFIPFGSIVLLVFYCIEGNRGSNEYGLDPKENIDLLSN